MAAEKMQAMVLTKLAPIKTRPLKLMSIDKPVIKSRTSLLIEIEACGVCRSNLHLIEGDWKRYGTPSHLPLVPGHEVVGIVKKVGNGVRRVKVVTELASSPYLGPASDASITRQGGRTCVRAPR